MWFAKFQVLMCEPQSICCKLLVLSWLHKNIDFLISEDEIIFQFAGENESAEVIGICSKPQDLGVLSENRNLWNPGRRRLQTTTTHNIRTCRLWNFKLFSTHRFLFNFKFSYFLGIPPRLEKMVSHMGCNFECDLIFNHFGPFRSRYCWILTGIWLTKIKIDM